MKKIALVALGAITSVITAQADTFRIGERGYFEKSGINVMAFQDTYPEGHQAGDRMLQEVARVMQQRFGTEDTYRIGGDEFVCFRVDGQVEKVSSEIKKMSLELAKKGYFVSFGSAVYKKTQDEFDIYEIVKEAESNMFDAKRKYYHEMDIDRTNRQGNI